MTATDIAAMIAEALADSDRIAAAFVIKSFISDDEDGPVALEVTTQGGKHWAVRIERL